MNTCPSQKRMYDTAIQAEQALLDLQSRIDFRTGDGPVGVYRCDVCGAYHLTSSGPVNPFLASQLREGSVARQREANRWLGKLKGRR
jgi:hypothetical protein